MISKVFREAVLHLIEGNLSELEIQLQQFSKLANVRSEAAYVADAKLDAIEDQWQNVPAGQAFNNGHKEITEFL